MCVHKSVCLFYSKVDFFFDIGQKKEGVSPSFSSVLVAYEAYEAYMPYKALIIPDTS